MKISNVVIFFISFVPLLLYNILMRCQVKKRFIFLVGWVCYLQCVVNRLSKSQKISMVGYISSSQKDRSASIVPGKIRQNIIHLRISQHAIPLNCKILIFVKTLRNFLQAFLLVLVHYDHEECPELRTFTQISELNHVHHTYTYMRLSNF